jgi:hypothetical protein
MNRRMGRKPKYILKGISKIRPKLLNNTMSLYTFQTVLLSAQKTGTPNLTNTSLSATGVTYLSGADVVVTSRQVGVVSLSTTEVGLAFSPVDFSVGTTVNTASSFSLANFPSVTVNVLGSVFNIPASLHLTTMALVNTDNSYSVFPFLSSVTTVPVSAFSETFSVSTPDTRRKRLLGY